MGFDQVTSNQTELPTTLLKIMLSSLSYSIVLLVVHFEKNAEHHYSVFLIILPDS